MDYKKHYDQLITTRRARLSHEGYREIHHVIPKSMGGCDDISNLVSLTAREHFIAHWLLWRIHRNKQTAFAFFCMQKWKKKNAKMFSSIAYQEAREAMSREASIIMSKQTHWKGRKQTAEHIENRVKKLRNRSRNLSKETCEKISQSMKKYRSENPLIFSDEHREKLSQAAKKLKGFKHSEESRRNMSLASIGKSPTKGNTGNKHTEYSKRKMSETIKSNSASKHYRCPHCDSEGIGRSFKGWHFDKCRKLNDGRVRRENESQDPNFDCNYSTE